MKAYTVTLRFAVEDDVASPDQWEWDEILDYAVGDPADNGIWILALPKVKEVKAPTPSQMVAVFGVDPESDEEVSL